MASGLNTGLKPTFGLKTKKHGSNNIEVFLTEVKKILLKETFRRRRFEHIKKKTREIYEVLQNMKNSVSVYVPTYKTNSTGVTEIEDYERWVSDHLLKADVLAL